LVFDGTNVNLIIGIFKELINQIFAQTNKKFIF